MRGARFLGLIAFSVFAAGTLVFAGVSEAGVAEGKKVVDAKKCSGCHQMEGPAKEKTIADQLAKKAPELWYAGSKFQKAFLEKWLADPKPIRAMKYYSLKEKNAGDHPKLAGAEVADVTAYLMSLTSADVKAAGIKGAGGPQGRILFEKKQGCYGCHETKKGGNVVGGLSGPTLVGAGDRLNPDWIFAYMSTPAVFKPVKDMPVYEGILSDPEIKVISEYVASFK